MRKDDWIYVVVFGIFLFVILLMILALLNFNTPARAETTYHQYLPFTMSDTPCLCMVPPSDWHPKPPSKRYRILYVSIVQC